MSFTDRIKTWKGYSEEIATKISDEEKEAAKAEKKAAKEAAKAAKEAEKAEKKAAKEAAKAEKKAAKEAKKAEEIEQAKTTPLLHSGSFRAEKEQLCKPYNLSRKQAKSIPAWVNKAIDNEARAKAGLNNAAFHFGFNGEANRILKERWQEEYEKQSEAAQAAHQYLANLSGSRPGAGVGTIVAGIGVSEILF